jgi:hypothetical protein
MSDELTKLKQTAASVFQGQQAGKLQAFEKHAGNIFLMFRALGAHVTEAGDRKEMLFYYDRFARFFRAWLGGRVGAAPTLNQACGFYDLLYMMKWRSINEPTDLTSFNPDVLEPFVAFVRKSPWAGEPENRQLPSGAQPARLAYIASWDNLSSANACARVTWTTILGHKTLRGNHGSLVVYCTMRPAPDLVEAARKASIELKNMWRAGGTEETARAILREVEKDGIDALVIDTPDALATVLIVKRIAPVQIYLELGFDAWRAPNIEFCFQSFSVRWKELVNSPDRCARLPLIDHIDFLAPERSLAEIDALRKTIHAVLPDGQTPDIIYGFFGRMTKVTLPWLKLLVRILQATPRAVGYIGGGGGQSPIVENFLRTSSVANRIVYQPRYVDGHIVGRVINVFLDTFPFPGSLACLECQAKGVPVVWMPEGYKDQMAERLEIYRDKSLRAANEDEFVRLAVELAQPERCEQASAEAKALAHKFGHGEENAGQIEQVIQHFSSVVKVA